jgi:hypothetical protein
MSVLLYTLGRPAQPQPHLFGLRMIFSEKLTLTNGECMRAFWSIIVLMCVQACGGSSDAAGSSGKIEDFVAGYCRAARNCCTGRPKQPDPLSDCEPEVERQIDLISSIRSGKTKLLEPAFNNCVKQLDEVSRTCTASVAMGCQLFFQGTVREDGACLDVVECERGATPVGCFKFGDAASSDSAPGVCHALRRSRAGEPCAVSGDEHYYGTTYSTPDDTLPLAYCDARDALYCDVKTCKPFVKEGGACTADACAPGLYCDEVCKPYLVDGASCDSQVPAKKCTPGELCENGRCSAPTLADTKICTGDFN